MLFIVRDVVYCLSSLFLPLSLILQVIPAEASKFLSFSNSGRRQLYQAVRPQPKMCPSSCASGYNHVQKVYSRPRTLRSSINEPQSRIQTSGITKPRNTKGTNLILKNNECNRIQ